MVATPEQTQTTDASATTPAPAAADPLDTPSPALANVVVILGFALVFTTFLTDSPWSWIIGGVLIVAGALWAGFTTGDRPTTDASHVPAVEGARAVRHGATPPAEPTASRGVHDDGHAG